MELKREINRGGDELEDEDLKATIREYMAGYADPVSFYVDKLALIFYVHSLQFWRFVALSLLLCLI